MYPLYFKDSDRYFSEYLKDFDLLKEANFFTPMCKSEDKIKTGYLDVVCRGIDDKSVIK